MPRAARTPLAYANLLLQASNTGDVADGDPLLQLISTV